MAKGTPRGGVGETKTLKLAHTAAVEKHDVIVSGGNVLIAIDDYAANEEGVYIFRGGASFPKGSGAIGAATVVYWDSAAGVITTTVTANTKAGITTEAAASVATEVFVALREN